MGSCTCTDTLGYEFINKIGVSMIFYNVCKTIQRKSISTDLRNIKFRINKDKPLIHLKAVANGITLGNHIINNEETNTGYYSYFNTTLNPMQLCGRINLIHDKRLYIKDKQSGFNDLVKNIRRSKNNKKK